MKQNHYANVKLKFFKSADTHYSNILKGSIITSCAIPSAVPQTHSLFLPRQHPQKPSSAPWLSKNWTIRGWFCKTAQISGVNCLVSWELELFERSVSLTFASSSSIKIWIISKDFSRLTLALEMATVKADLQWEVAFNAFVEIWFLQRVFVDRIRNLMSMSTKSSNAMALNFYFMNIVFTLNIIHYFELLVRPTLMQYAKKSSVNILVQKLLIKWWWNWPVIIECQRFWLDRFFLLSLPYRWQSLISSTELTSMPASRTIILTTSGLILCVATLSGDRVHDLRSRFVRCSKSWLRTFSRIFCKNVCEKIMSHNSKQVCDKTEWYFVTYFT